MCVTLHRALSGHWRSGGHSSGGFWVNLRDVSGTYLEHLGATSGRYRSGSSGRVPLHRAPLWVSGGYLVPQDTRELCWRHCDNMLYDDVADGKPYCITAKALKRWATKVAFSLGVEHGGGLRIIPSLKLGRAGRWLAFSHSHAFRDGYAPDGAIIIQNLLNAYSRRFVEWNG